MRTRLPIVAVVLCFGVSCAAAEPATMRVKTERFTARIDHGSLVALEEPGGRVLVRAPAQGRGMGIHRIEATHWATSSTGPETLGPSEPAVLRCAGFADLAGASGECTFAVDQASGDLVVRQRATSPGKGVWGVSWSIAEIPPEYAILVPGGSGLRLSADSPGGRHEFDYPISWEAQMVVVEGPTGGFYVWAEDAQGRFKRLVVERRPTGWRLGLVSINFAPFDGLAACESVTWRLNVYEGDWRTAARRYRRWAEANLRPTPVEKQQPGWVKDIRACVIMGLDRDMLEALPKRFDPPQTLLYLPDWRQAGYDRDYPEYDKPVATLDPFIGRAHALGFRVMLHVNYFGVDPLNPLYKRFEPYQVRDPWAKHEKQWWTWDRADPPIKFAYINPAFRGWRDHFTAAMQQLCRRTKTDALHLDQTLCIYNDHNGLIDGTSMLEGNLALHRQLRQALPEVALSGEGLNEVTCRHEAFAQRHVWGLDHTTGRWDRRWLAAAHPISSYLLRPYTTIYGYLGYTPPENGQLYAAWNAAYEHWGVIPTLVPQRESLRQPAGFARQLLEEVAFWQQERLAIDLDGPWPAEVAFPWRTADGRRAVRTVDGRLVCGDRLVSRTISGVGRLEAPGTIPGWPAYDPSRLLGLDPEHWYPYFNEPRDQAAFHVAELPEDLVVEGVFAGDDMATVGTRSRSIVLADLAATIDRATCGVRPRSGPARENLGPLEGDGPEGAQFNSQGDTLFAHPPWKTDAGGSAFARYALDLPRGGRLELASEVAMDPGAVGPGKSDGVTFAVTVRSGDRRLHAELHNATAERRTLGLDLTPLAGRQVTVELGVDPGPAGLPSFDWARWSRPRIERHAESQGTIALAGAKPWALALDARGEQRIERAGPLQRVRAAVPGTVFFLARRPEPATLPVDLARRPFHLAVFRDTGERLGSARFATVQRTPGTVGGVSREGLFAHPPDHGRTVAHFPMTRVQQPAEFRAWVGIRDGSTSDGVIFIVQLNGREIARRRMVPGKWEPLSGELALPAGTASPTDAVGTPVVLSLVTDSAGPFNCDWACWGEPRIETRR